MHFARFPGRGLGSLAARLGVLVEEVARTAPGLNQRLRRARAEMEHYLEYCSELSSLVGKAAALVAEAP